MNPINEENLLVDVCGLSVPLLGSTVKADTGIEPAKSLQNIVSF